MKVIEAVIMITCTAIVLMFIANNKLKNKEPINQPICECDSLKVINSLLIEEIHKWEDHAIRMKRIAGVPDTISWSYKQKVIHPVNTYNLNH